MNSKVLILNNSAKDPKEKPLQMPSKSQTEFEKWKRANNINPITKVFFCDEKFPDIISALKSRGWFQNDSGDSPHFDLRFSRNARVPKTINEWQMCNHFPRNYDLSAKWNLVSTIKKNENITKMNHLSYFPRCFQLEKKEGLQEFCNTFKLIYAASVLKKFAENPQLDEFIRAVQANTICDRWVKSFNSKCVNDVIVLESEWRVLRNENSQSLKEDGKYEEIDQVQVDKIHKTLETLQKLDPQFDLNGFRNIWIIKPGKKSRGRDIKVLSDLDEIKRHIQEANYWVAQKYIENPLLINNRKFDIRQWVLISSSDPLTIWIYKRCYLRFTVEEFSFSDLSNNFMHLTNNSISKFSDNFIENSSMWHSRDFQSFLQEKYGEDVWSSFMYENVKHIVISSILTVGRLGRKNSFELLGFDLMVDTSLKCWLIEINTSPAMDYSTPITEEYVKSAAEDVIKVAVDIGLHGSQDPGDFEIIYTQSVKR